MPARAGRAFPTLLLRPLVGGHAILYDGGATSTEVTVALTASGAFGVATGAATVATVSVTADGAAGASAGASTAVAAATTAVGTTLNNADRALVVTLTASGRLDTLTGGERTVVVTLSAGGVVHMFGAATGTGIAVSRAASGSADYHSASVTSLIVAAVTADGFVSLLAPTPTEDSTTVIAAGNVVSGVPAETSLVRVDPESVHAVISA